MALCLRDPSDSFILPPSLLPCPLPLLRNGWLLVGENEKPWRHVLWSLHMLQDLGFENWGGQFVQGPVPPSSSF